MNCVNPAIFTRWGLCWESPEEPLGLETPDGRTYTFFARGTGEVMGFAEFDHYAQVCELHSLALKTTRDFGSAATLFARAPQAVFKIVALPYDDSFPPAMAGGEAVPAYWTNYFDWTFFTKAYGVRYSLTHEWFEDGSLRLTVDRYVEGELRAGSHVFIYPQEAVDGVMERDLVIESGCFLLISDCQLCYETLSYGGQFYQIFEDNRPTGEFTYLPSDARGPLEALLEIYPACLFQDEVSRPPRRHFGLF